RRRGARARRSARAIGGRGGGGRRAPSQSLALHEFVEAALLPVRRFFLVEEREFLGVEFAEELLPGNPLQTLVRRIEIEPEDSGAALPGRGGDGRGLAAAVLRPAADGVVVLGGLGVGHGTLPGLKSQSLQPLETRLGSRNRRSTPW